MNTLINKYKYAVGGIIVLLILLGAILFWPKSPEAFIVSPENPKQGDTVFIKVKSQAAVTGTFNNEKLDFYRNGKTSEWFAFLGIDADQKPGNYIISINNHQFTKEIKVGLAKFSTAPTAPAPSQAATGISNATAVANIFGNDNPAIDNVLNKPTATPYFFAPFSFPLKNMASGGLSFGKFIGIGSRKVQHFGSDLNAAMDTNVYAVNDGKVAATLKLSNYGNTVIIDHGLNIFSLYLHLDEFKVAKGDMVRRGQLIGLSGATGYVTGPHLHFSMRVGSSRVDPIEFIKTTGQLNENVFLASISSAFSNLINLFK